MEDLDASNIIGEAVLDILVAKYMRSHNSGGCLIVGVGDVNILDVVVGGGVVSDHSIEGVSEIKQDQI